MFAAGMKSRAFGRTIRAHQTHERPPPLRRRPQRGNVTITWLALLACALLFGLLLFSRQSPRDSTSLSRLALLHGVQRIRGESEESLRNRTTAASRWPYSHPEAEFVWWARAWHRVIAALRHGYRACVSHRRKAKPIS
jgi:hypothetical protein